MECVEGSIPILWRADSLPVKPAVCGERASVPPPAPDRSANAGSAGLPLEGEGTCLWMPNSCAVCDAVILSGAGSMGGWEGLFRR